MGGFQRNLCPDDFSSPGVSQNDGVPCFCKADLRVDVPNMPLGF